MVISEIIIRHKGGLDWLNFGDIGYMTKGGMLFRVDCVKQMVVRYNGFKFFPFLIEKSIISHEAVKSCCVVGILDKERSQRKLPAVRILLNLKFVGWEELVRKELAKFYLKELPKYA